MSKISNKNYYCPTCGNKEIHQTNHFGEIYCHCKNCGNSPLYCSEQDTHKDLPFISATLRYYQYDLNNVSENKTYHELVKELKQRGYEVFAAIPYNFKQYKALKEHNDKKIKLYNPCQFDNQYVSDIGRVFKWKEAQYPNPRIKEGYYLDIKENGENVAL